MTSHTVDIEQAIADNERDLLAYFHRRIANPADAVEAFGELLLAAWRSRRRMPTEPTSARMWLFGVAHNVLRNTRRTLARRSEATQRMRELVATQESSESATQRQGDVADAISTLAPEDAELIRLIYWDGFRSHEAATVLGIKPSTARTRLAKAKTSLRGVLENEPQLIAGPNV